MKNKLDVDKDLEDVFEFAEADRNLEDKQRRREKFEKKQFDKSKPKKFSRYDDEDDDN